MKLLYWILGLIVVLGLGYYLIYPAFIVLESHDVVTGIDVASGVFVPASYGVAGNVSLVDIGGAQYVLFFSDFETVNGPDLHIYLSTDTSLDDAIDLGSLTATRGDVAYLLDSSLDVSRYTHVLVWCKPFSVLFSYAVLDYIHKNDV